MLLSFKISVLNKCFQFSSQVLLSRCALLQLFWMDVLVQFSELLLYFALQVPVSSKTVQSDTRNFVVLVPSLCAVYESK
jgi:hypothetical protein